jgi:arylsulfate sulfotransferase
MEFRNSPIIEKAPNSTTPLVGIVTFETDEPATAEIDIDDGKQSRTVSFNYAPARQHSCQVLGLKPDTAHQLTVRARGESGEITEAPNRLELKTPPLPDDFPPIEVLSCTPEKREPGYIIFSASYGAMNKIPEKPGFLVAMDQQGDIVWHHRENDPIYDVRRLPNGNLAYATNDARLIEIDMLGNVQHTWYPTGKYKDGLDGGTPLETEAIHHAFWPMDSGNILMLSIEQLEFDDWPGNDKDPDAPRAPAKVIGDTIIEFQPDGTIVNEWRLSEMMDPKRICYGRSPHSGPARDTRTPMTGPTPTG